MIIEFHQPLNKAQAGAMQRVGFNFRGLHGSRETWFLRDTVDQFVHLDLNEVFHIAALTRLDFTVRHEASTP